MSVTMKDNTRQVLAALAQAEERLLIRWGMRGEAAVKPKVPVDSGRLRNSIKYEPNTKKKEVYIGSSQKDDDTSYAPHVEFGTYKSRAQPYLKPGIMGSIDDFKQDAEKELGAIK